MTSARPFAAEKDPEMSKSHDLVVRNGTLVDGTGSAPIDGDIAIDNGKISAIGQVHGSGTEEIDAGGCIVTPGFVDIHTGPDRSGDWDKHLAPRHGMG